MVSHKDKDMSPKMTRGTSIASSSMAILKAANDENTLLLQRCKSRCGYSVQRTDRKIMSQSNVTTSGDGSASWCPAHQSRSVRQRTLNTDNKQETIWRHGMFDRKSSSPRKRQDLVCTPAAMTGIIVTIVTAWMGVACYVNGRRCGRTHCKIDGILLPLLSLVGVLNLLGVTAFGWNAYSEAVWIILMISFVPEFFGLIQQLRRDREVR